MKIKKGDLVSRISYNNDVIFRVCNIKEDGGGERIAFLKGINVRLFADSPESDLTPATFEQIKEDIKVYEAMTRQNPKDKNKGEKKKPKISVKRTKEFCHAWKSSSHRRGWGIFKAMFR